ncbi:TPA: hypothetical protein ACG6EL_004233, partial [Escherichia coli]
QTRYLLLNLIMVRCAEIITPHGKTGKSTPEHWDKLNKLELTTFYYLSRRTMASKKSSIKQE